MAVSPPWCAALLIAASIHGIGDVRGDGIMRRTIDLSGEGWRLWLDREAAWKGDRLHVPPADIARLPVRGPTGGWQVLAVKGIDVRVPGTVEEHYWDEIGDYVGVSWWWRELAVPAEAVGKRVILQFEAVRLRAEVFVDDKLVGHDTVGNTPFEVDITDHVVAGRPCRLVVRVTDPGGNFIWKDVIADRWGDQRIPASHGFGGVTGPVRLLIVDPVHVHDVFVKNKPTITDIDVEATVRNATGGAFRGDLRIEIVAANGGRALYDRTWPDLEFAGGDQVVSRSVSVPDALPWSPDDPNLYCCNVTVGDRDRAAVRFGFRWFAVDGVGEDAKFRLNGKRIVLRSAISWGFWPGNGITPTPELAKKNILAAKTLGLNMLSFHRCIGQPISLDLADELGLLIHEEPGGYTCGDGDALAFALAREKLLRMVRRDRNHPSLVIVNMINEEQKAPAERHRKDMADAHRLDPTRLITYTSGWAKDGDDPIKLHMRPYDGRQYTRGWYDYHHATGPGVYRDESYRGPREHGWHTDNWEEIVFWGEEGANAAPPRLERIQEALEGRPNGWDGADYRAWFGAYERYLDDKELRAFFPTVDDLTRSLGNVAYYYQGRIMENVRAGDTTDGYVINGWEAQKWENHSGVVDCFRNFKGDPDLLARYNAPLYVAVKLWNKVGRAPATVVADFFIVNETGVHGPHALTVTLRDPQHRSAWTNTYPVTVTGGDRYGELLASGIAIRADAGPGRYTVEAELRARSSGDEPDPDRAPVASGRDEVFLVDGTSPPASARGAVVESTETIRAYLRSAGHGELPRYSDDLDALDYIVIGEHNPVPKAIVPTARLQTPDGAAPGLRGEYFRGIDFDEPVLTRVDPVIDLNFGPAGPDPEVGGQKYSCRWQGRIVAEETGPHQFHVVSDDGVRLWVDRRLIIEQWDQQAPRMDSRLPVHLKAGEAYDIKIEHFQWDGGASLQLLWTKPSMKAGADALLAGILRRVRDDGTTAIFVDRADDWAGLLAERGVIRYHGRMNHGLYWLGGNFFVREHPLFDGLPVNGAMNWEYQELVHYGRRRFGLLLEGEEAVVGCVTGHEHAVATAVGVVRHGKGRIVLSTLDILPLLGAPPGPADVARKVFLNYLRYGAGETLGRRSFRSEPRP